MTLIVCDVTPFAETVIVAERCVSDVFAEAVAVIVPLFEPDAGLIVNQLADDVAVHDVLLVTVTVLLSPLAIKLSDEGETVNVLVGVEFAGS